MKVTQWFSPRVNPVHKGFYERDYPARCTPAAMQFESRDYWDGKNWYLGYWDARRAELTYVNLQMDGVFSWRGLAVKP